MFNLETEMAKWRSTLIRAGLLPGTIDELESHLRDEIGRLTSGVGLEEAFSLAKLRLGQPAEIEKEFNAAIPSLRLVGRGALVVRFLSVLIRNRDKILLCLAIGAVLAAAYWRFFPPPFESEAKFVVRHAVTNDRAGLQTAVEKRPDDDPEVGVALSVLASFDLARDVAAETGAGRILAGGGVAGDIPAAAAYIQRHLQIQMPAHSSIILLRFRTPDADLATPLLQSLVDRSIRHFRDVRPFQNVVVIQSPTPASQNWTPSYVAMAWFVGAGFLAGLAWALLTELQGRSPPSPPAARDGECRDTASA